MFLNYFLALCQIVLAFCTFAVFYYELREGVIHSRGEVVVYLLVVLMLAISSGRLAQFF